MLPSVLCLKNKQLLFTTVCLSHTSVCDVHTSIVLPGSQHCLHHHMIMHTFNVPPRHSLCFSVCTVCRELVWCTVFVLWPDLCEPLTPLLCFQAYPLFNCVYTCLSCGCAVSRLIVVDVTLSHCCSCHFPPPPPTSRHVHFSSTCAPFAMQLCNEQAWCEPFYTFFMNPTVCYIPFFIYVYTYCHVVVQVNRSSVDCFIPSSCPPPPVLLTALFHSVASTCKCPFFIWLCKLAKTPCTAFTPALCAYRCPESKLCSVGMYPACSFHCIHCLFLISVLIHLSPNILMNAEGMVNVGVSNPVSVYIFHGMTKA